MGLDILLIAIIVASSTSLIGVFLVIRKMSMMTDAISHTVLLGIVLAFLIIPDLNSPLLIFGAVLMGLITVFLTEGLVNTNLVKADAATGVIFPFLFSIAIIIISLFVNTVHMDIDAVLLGKLELSSIDQLIIFNKAIGPKSLYISLLILIINLSFVFIFYKELKLISFDSALAATLGFMPIFIHYLLMGLVSLTAVTAFNSVGSILVISLMIGPAITAMQFTKDLKYTIIFSVLIAIFNSITGYFVAILINITISGVIATITLITFLLVLLFNPKNGITAKIIKTKNQKKDFALLVLLMHINNHSNVTTTSLCQDLRYNKSMIIKMVKYLEYNLLVIKDDNNNLFLTKDGITYHNNNISYLND